MSIALGVRRLWDDHRLTDKQDLEREAAEMYSDEQREKAKHNLDDDSHGMDEERVSDKTVSDKATGEIKT